MESEQKIFGIGMFKTGTTTLGRCFEILDYKHGGGHWNILNDAWWENCAGWQRHHKKIYNFATRYQTFEDAPWLFLYRELDKWFPQSRFILTLRKSSEALIRSEEKWYASQSNEEVTSEFLERIKWRYEKHNLEVRNYFKDTPSKLLEVCWENGDGWQEVCDFLGVSVPVDQSGKFLDLPRLNSAGSHSSCKHRMKLRVRKMLSRCGIDLPHRL